MSDFVNFTLVSPSKVGIYAACPIRLVWDSSRPGSPFSSKWADFGTVCHWTTMERLGCAPADIPNDDIQRSARQLETGSDAVYEARIERCTEMACKALAIELGELPNGVRWVSEVPVADPTLLPTRKSRKGVVTGFGGSIDLIRSDRSVIVDLKFVSKPVYKLKVEYLWQLGSYAMLTGIKKTYIQWVITDGKSYFHLTIDWSLPHYVDLMARIRKFVERTGHANFAAHAYPIEGDQCEYCEHNPGSRNFNSMVEICPVKAVPSPQQGIDSTTRGQGMGWLEDLQTEAAQEANPKTPQLF